MRSLLLSALIAASLSATAQAEVYKWVDENGQVHYGERAPNSAKAERVKIRRAPPLPATEVDVEPEPEADPEAPRQAKPEVATQRDSENCELARRNLEVLQDLSITRFREAPDAEPTAYSAEQRQARIDEAREFITQYCDQ